MANNFSSTDALNWNFCRLLVCSAVFAQQKENSYSKFYYVTENPHPLVKTFILFSFSMKASLIIL